MELLALEFLESSSSSDEDDLIFFRKIGGKYSKLLTIYGMLLVVLMKRR